MNATDPVSQEHNTLAKAYKQRCKVSTQEDRCLICGSIENHPSRVFCPKHHQDFSNDTSGQGFLLFVMTHPDGNLHPCVSSLLCAECGQRIVGLDYLCETCRVAK